MQVELSHDAFVGECPNCGRQLTGLAAYGKEQTIWCVRRDAFCNVWSAHLCVRFLHLGVAPLTGCVRRVRRVANQTSPVCGHAARALSGCRAACTH